MELYTNNSKLFYFIYIEMKEQLTNDCRIIYYYNVLKFNNNIIRLALSKFFFELKFKVISVYFRVLFRLIFKYVRWFFFVCRSKKLQNNFKLFLFINKKFLKNYFKKNKLKTVSKRLKFLKLLKRFFLLKKLGLNIYVWEHYFLNIRHISYTKIFINQVINKLNFSLLAFNFRTRFYISGKAKLFKKFLFDRKIALHLFYFKRLFLSLFMKLKIHYGKFNLKINSKLGIYKKVLKQWWFGSKFMLGDFRYKFFFNRTLKFGKMLIPTYNQLYYMRYNRGYQEDFISSVKYFTKLYNASEQSREDFLSKRGYYSQVHFRVPVNNRLIFTNNYLLCYLHYDIFLRFLFIAFKFLFISTVKFNDFRIKLLKKGLSRSSFYRFIKLYLRFRRFKASLNFSKIVFKNQNLFVKQQVKQFNVANLKKELKKSAISSMLYTRSRVAFSSHRLSFSRVSLGRMFLSLGLINELDLKKSKNKIYCIRTKGLSNYKFKNLTKFVSFKKQFVILNDFIQFNNYNNLEKNKQSKQDMVFKLENNFVISMQLYKKLFRICWSLRRKYYKAKEETMNINEIKPLFKLKRRFMFFNNYLILVRNRMFRIKMMLFQETGSFRSFKKLVNYGFVGLISGKMLQKGLTYNRWLYKEVSSGIKNRTLFPVKCLSILPKKFGYSVSDKFNFFSNINYGKRYFFQLGSQKIKSKRSLGLLPIWRNLIQRQSYFYFLKKAKLKVFNYITQCYALMRSMKFKSNEGLFIFRNKIMPSRRLLNNIFKSKRKNFLFKGGKRNLYLNCNLNGLPKQLKSYKFFIQKNMNRLRSLGVFNLLRNRIKFKRFFKERFLRKYKTKKRLSKKDKKFVYKYLNKFQQKNRKAKFNWKNYKNFGNRRYFKFPEVVVFYKKTVNNLYWTASDLFGNVLIWMSVRKAGCSKREKRTAFARQKCGEAFMSQLKTKKLNRISIFVRYKFKKEIKKTFKLFRKKRIFIRRILVSFRYSHNGLRLRKMKRG